MKTKAELEAIMDEAITNVQKIDIALSMEANSKHRRELEKARRDWEEKYQRIRRTYHVMYEGKVS